MIYSLKVLNRTNKGKIVYMYKMYKRYTLKIFSIDIQCIKVRDYVRRGDT